MSKYGCCTLSFCNYDPCNWNGTGSCDNCPYYDRNFFREYEREDKLFTAKERSDILNAFNLYFESQGVDITAVGYKDDGETFTIICKRRHDK